MNIKSFSVILLTFVLFLSCKKETPEPSVYFPLVRGIVQSNCQSCHLSTGYWTGRPTRFDNDSDMVAAAASIKASVADPATLMNKRMPEGGSLSTADVQTIVKWFEKGGKATD